MIGQLVSDLIRSECRDQAPASLALSSKVLQRGKTVGQTEMVKWTNARIDHRPSRRNCPILVDQDHLIGLSNFHRCGLCGTACGPRVLTRNFQKREANTRRNMVGPKIWSLSSSSLARPES